LKDGKKHIGSNVEANRDKPRFGSIIMNSAENQHEIVRLNLKNLSSPHQLFSENGSQSKSDMQGFKDDKNKNMLMGSALSNGERSKPSNNN